RRSLPRGLDPAGGTGPGDQSHPAGDDGDRSHLPPPFRPGRRSRYRRPRLQRTPRARPGRRLAPDRAPRARHPVPGNRRAGGPVVEEAARAAGRDPASIVRATALSISEPWDQVRRRVDQLAGIGVGYLTVSWPSEGRERIEEFTADVMPELMAS